MKPTQVLTYLLAGVVVVVLGVGVYIGVKNTDTDTSKSNGGGGGSTSQGGGVWQGIGKSLGNAVDSIVSGVTTLKAGAK